MSESPEKHNIMRRDYKTLSEVKQMQVKGIKDICQSFWDACDSIGTSRELSIAKERIEEAAMWAVKGITG